MSFSKPSHDAFDLNSGLTTRDGDLHTIAVMNNGAVRVSRHVRWTDFAVVVPIIAIIVAGTARIDVEPDERAVDALAFACAITGAAALVVWRRWPVATIAVVALTTVVYIARDYPPGPAFLPGLLAVLALGYSTPKRVAWLGAGGFVLAVFVADLIAHDGLSIALFLLPAWASAALLAGQALAARGERAAVERERAAHAHERAIAAERLRIAQDLHDSVAHAMSTINVQSGVAAHLLDRDPSQARGALEAIRSASGDALDELGAILGALREPDAALPTSPLGTLADVPALVERARADGLPVTVTVAGDTGAAPPTIGTAAYRVVQEALTNVRRHAGPDAAATIAIVVSEHGAVELRVTDDGLGAPADEVGNGFGLVGMRERVESTGGVLRVGPRPAGGFAVVATWNR